MADYVVRDNTGNIVGRISESGPSCMGCLVMSVLAAIIWGGISLYQFVQSRIADNRIEAQRVALSPAALDAYTGEYDYGRYKIRIERRGNKLYNKSVEEFCELVPISTQEFIYRACVNGFEGKGHFERDGRGKMALIIIHRDGRAEKAIRAD